MKTAMQKMVDYLYENRYFDVVPVAKELLEKEKEQICNAYTDGLEGPYIGAEEYYNQTYNQETLKEI